MNSENTLSADIEVVEFSPNGLTATLRLQPGADSRASQITDQLNKLKVNDLVLQGSLGGPWRIRSSGSVTITGAVEAAMINAKGSIQIQGGIVGNDKGKCITEQSFVGKFLSHACVIAERDVTLSGEVIDSKVVCGGKLSSITGRILGGRVSANGGVICDTLGSPNEVRTIVEAGTHQILPLITAMARIEIDANTRRVRDIREKVGPLLQNLKSLTAQQRERATELHYEADELEEQTNTKSAQLEERCCTIRKAAREEIVVNGVAHPGVTLRFARVETTLRSKLEGPLRVVARNTGSASEVILFEKSNDAGRILESRQLTENTDDA